MTWVHNALRQLVNTHKALAAEIRSKEKAKKHGTRTIAVFQRIAAALKQAGVDPEVDVPEVVFADGDDSNLRNLRSEGILAFDADVVFAEVPQAIRQTTGKKAERELLEEKTKGIAQVLEAYGAFRKLNYEQQQQLLRSIVSIFMSGE